VAAQLSGAEDRSSALIHPAPPQPAPKGEESAPKKESPKKKRTGPTVSLDANLVSVDGTPVKGAKVTFTSHKYNPKNHASIEYAWTAISDERGHARVDAPADEVDINAGCRVEP